MSVMSTPSRKSAFGGTLEPGQHAQQGGLAGAGTTQQGEDLALVDVEGHVVDRQRFVELLAYPVDFDQHFFTLLAALEGFLVGTGGYRHYQTPKGDSGLGRSINTIWRPGMGARLGSGFDLGPTPGDQALHRTGMCFLHIQTLKHRLGDRLTRPRERPCP
jgi:hypothetical protein